MLWLCGECTRGLGDVDPKVVLRRACSVGGAYGDGAPQVVEPVGEPAPEGGLQVVVGEACFAGAEDGFFGGVLGEAVAYEGGGDGVAAAGGGVDPGPR